MKFLTLDYYLRKKHIFKKRTCFSWFHKRFYVHRFGSLAYIAYKKQRFDLVFFRLVKKFFRRKFIRRRTIFQKPSFWLRVVPNHILSKKSRGARMGAGVGKLVRLTALLYPHQSVLEFKFFSPKSLLLIEKFFLFKCGLYFFLAF